MKRLIVFCLIFALLTACGPGEPPFTDNGNPGQIKVIAFYDDNNNGTMDNEETVVQAQAIVAISQEISCPPANIPIFVDTDANGVHLFSDLKPGKYCIALSNGFNPTTKFTQEVYVSSDAVTEVAFGVAR